MKSCFKVFRHRRRNLILLLVVVAAVCLIFLALNDNLSTKSSAKAVQRRPISVVELPRTAAIAYPHTKIAYSHTKEIDNRIPKFSQKWTVNGSSALVSSTLLSKQKVNRLSFVRRGSSGKPPNWNRALYYNASSTPEAFLRWRREREVMCDGRMVGYDHEFVEARDMTIDRKFCTCALQGGELIRDVINQEELAEYYAFDVGCFQIGCAKRPSYFFNGENHLTKWMYSVAAHDVSDKVERVIDDFTIAVTRYEYANLFHTMTDWYNAFVIMQFFNRTSFDTNILIVDAHPYGALDSVWPQLFNSTVRLAGIATRTRFRNLVWGILGYNSLMKIFVSPTPPLIEDFRSFFLSAYDIDSRRQIDCAKLSILFIWRHNYLAHPRNPSGFVSRKIHNEEQLIQYIKRKNSNSVVTGIQIDSYGMRQQLQLVANADVLVGMHGAGLTHAMFLPKRSALIELVPNYWSPMSEHFKAICVWRGLVYKQWFNNDPRNEFSDQSTNIPPQIMNTLIKNAVRELCGHEKTTI